MDVQNTVMTLYGQFVALSAAFAVLLARVLRKRARREGCDAAALEVMEKIDVPTLALCCIPAALVGARLLYCLVRFDFFFVEMGPASVLRTWEGGFLLYGAVIGALAAAALLAKAKHVSAAHLLDELAAPGMMAVAICRMAEGTTTEGVGAWVESEFLCRFPFAVQNEYGEWQLAIYLLETIAAIAILLYLLRMRGAAPGEKILTALLLYGCCQVVLESLRMDACLRIGFVRVSQVLSAVAVLIVTLIRSIRVSKKQAVLRALLCVAMVAVAGVVEWALDKTPVNNVLLYAVMVAACIVMGLGGRRRCNAR